MGVQPKYDRIEGTPLAFLKFVRVTLVLGCVTRLLQTISLFALEGDWYSITYNLLGLTLTILALLWLGDMKWKGVLAYCGLFLLMMLDGIAAMALCAYYGLHESMGTAFGQVLAAMIILAPLWVYFGRRRLLFAPAPNTEKTQKPIPSASHASRKSISEDLETEWKGDGGFQGVSAERQQTDINPVKFCRNCGCELAPGSKFCSTCGTKVVKEW